MRVNHEITFIYARINGIAIHINMYVCMYVIVENNISHLCLIHVFG